MIALERISFNRLELIIYLFLRLYIIKGINDTFFMTSRAFMNGTLFLISAPSGAGKTSLVEAVLSDLKARTKIERVITYTSKKPRASEQNGRDYHFISEDQFKALLNQDFFMEYSRAYSDYYGSPRAVLEGLGKGTSYLLIIDRVGAQAVKKVLPEAVSIWIEAPSFNELKERLTGRGADSKERTVYRLNRAQIEMNLEREKPFYDFSIINDDFEQANRVLQSIITNKTAKKATKYPETVELQSIC